MKLAFRILGWFFVFLLLTAVTQTGGIIYLLWKIIAAFFKEQLATNRLIRIVGFPSFYLVITLLVTPFVALQFGRVALPFIETDRVKPATLITCLLNRHYVTKDLEEVTFEASSSLRKKHPSAQLIYFDANFPFWNGFPLLPHWSHSDGKKLDLAFVYSGEGGAIINNQPTYFGYGSFEPALANEQNAAHECASKGYFQYSALSYFTWFPEELMIHEKATGDLIIILHRKNEVNKIFIEPHLKQRWGLGQLSKIRFHGCHAVRHDDHIHFQVN